MSKIKNAEEKLTKSLKENICKTEDLDIFLLRMIRKLKKRQNVAENLIKSLKENICKNEDIDIFSLIMFRKLPKTPER